jgi:hypothetical protein
MCAGVRIRGRHLGSATMPREPAKPVDDAPKGLEHTGLSQGNAFTLPSGLSWKKQILSRINSVTGTANLANRRATGVDPGAFLGLSKKSDENQRQRAEQQRAERARSKA